MVFEGDMVKNKFESFFPKIALVSLVDIDT